MDPTYQYPGSELDVFVHARNWKRYWSSRIAPFVRGHVLEVGAGIGSNTPVMVTPDVRSWVCLEPDGQLTERLRAVLSADPRLAACEALEGTLATLEADRRFDTVVYIDVLEHIEDDRAEAALAASRLQPNGSLVVLAPAHQGLYTGFDRAIGHYRRYTKESLAALGPPGTTLRELYYLDSMGFWLSAANRLILKSAMPSVNQVKFWDRVIVPCSRRVDALTGYAFGKSVVAVWQKTA